MLVLSRLEEVLQDGFKRASIVRFRIYKASDWMCLCGDIAACGGSAMSRVFVVPCPFYMQRFRVASRT